MADCSKCKNADRCEEWDIDKVRRTGECEVYEPIDNTKFDVFSELKKRAQKEIEWLEEASVKTHDSYKKYKYQKIRVGIEAMLEHIYEIENEYKKQTVKTNADKIRSMSDEELAGLTITYNDYYGEYYCSDGERYDSHEDAIKHEIEYLQSEAE